VSLEPSGSLRKLPHPGPARRRKAPPREGCGEHSNDTSTGGVALMGRGPLEDPGRTVETGSPRADKDEPW